MAAPSSSYEAFWTHQSYALVGHGEKRSFPRLTYNALKGRGKTVYAVDPSAEQIEGEPVYHTLESLPARVDAVVLELPRDETKSWVEAAGRAGIERIWIHMNTDSPEALARAAELGLEEHHGTCALMYLSHGFSIHTVHRGIMKLAGKY